MLRKFLCLIAAGFIWNANAVQEGSVLYRKAPEVCRFFGGVLREIDSLATAGTPNNYVFTSLEDFFSYFIVQLNVYADKFDESLLSEVSKRFNDATTKLQQNKENSIDVVKAFLKAIISATSMLTNDFDNLKSCALRWSEYLNGDENQVFFYSLTETISEAKAILNVQ